MRAVSRGPLTISVREAGTIEPREKVTLKCEVDARSTTITFLAEEGSWVEAGDLVVELDASVLTDELYDEEIDVLDTEAEFVAARENLEVVRNQAEADVSQAELTLRFADEDVKQYTDGEYPKQLLAATNKVKLAQEQVQIALQTLQWSEKLAEKGFLAGSDLDRDRLAHQSAELDVELARKELELLEEYTRPRQLAQLESDLKQAELALDRVKRKSLADIAQAETSLQAREKQLLRQQAQLADIQRQVEHCTLRAPVAGMVVYATSGGGGRRGDDEPLQVGREVWEQQELVHIPVADSKSAHVKVHESALERVRPGLPVTLTVDALADRSYHGVVAKISPLPDAQMRWLNPDLKVYDTEVHLEGDTDGLRTGMSCRAEILLEHHEDVLSVPVHSVVRVDGQPTVYVLSEGRLEPRAVEVGLDNNRMIHVLAGLQEGELVALEPPLVDTDAPAAAPPPTGTERSDDADDAVDAGGRGDADADGSDGATTATVGSAGGGAGRGEGEPSAGTP